MAKKFDPKAKAKRDKIIAAVAGVIFLGVLAFSVPKTMAMMNQGNPAADDTLPSTSTTPAAPGGVPLAPPTLGGTAPAAPTAAAAVASYGQLVSFDRFRSKDPFEQQVSLEGAATVPAGGGAPQRDPDGERAGESGGIVSPGGGAAPAAPGPAKRGPTAPKPAPTAALISVNGAAAETVLLTQEFPRPPAEPIFRLAALTYASAKIGVAGGSYASGAATVTVKKGKPLTLVNTADGTRYEIRVVWIGAGAPPSTTTTAATSPTPPAATTTTTAP